MTTAPNLYTHKDSNIFKTWMLFTGFLAFVIALGWVFAQAYGNPGILYFAVMFSTVTSFVSYWYSDKIVLAMSRAVPVDMKANPELYRIVENLAITGGLPTPRIFVIPERQLNAFATGRDPKHAVVAVTQGLLETLDKTELEGVLAHEMSHIGNRDMLVGTMAVILVGFVSLLSDIFLRSLWRGGSAGRRSDDRGSAGGILLIIAIVLAVLAPISASLIQLAISRKREFLADASGALLTRYPEGLANALEKIAVDVTPMRFAKNTTAHLWIDDPFTGQTRTAWWHKLFMTHPPIEERIRALRGMKI
jgi:heat shock protein HtpX